MVCMNTGIKSQVQKITFGAIQKEFISKASHTYDGTEKQVAEIVLKWTRNLIGS